MKIITGKVRFSYANVWEPKSINGGEPKYSVSIIIPKTDEETLKKINVAIEAAKSQGTASLVTSYLITIKHLLGMGMWIDQRMRPMLAVILLMLIAL